MLGRATSANCNTPWSVPLSWVMAPWRQAVERAMRLSEGNMTKAAEYLGITRFALYRKIEKLGL